MNVNKNMSGCFPQPPQAWLSLEIQCNAHSGRTSLSYTMANFQYSCFVILKAVLHGRTYKCFVTIKRNVFKHRYANALNL